MDETKEPENQIVTIKENDEKKFCNKYEICVGTFFIIVLSFLAVNAYFKLNFLP